MSRPADASTFASGLLPFRLAVGLFLSLLVGPAGVAIAQQNNPQLGSSQPDRSNEAEDSQAMALYADAANYQTGGATDLAVEAWQKFLKQYPEHKLAAEAAHFLGVSYMQTDPPQYVAAANAFGRALEKKSYKYREESLVNRGWSLLAASGNEPQRDKQRLQQALASFEQLRDEFPRSDFLDRAYFYSGEAAYGLDDAERAVQFYNAMLKLPEADKSPLRCDALYALGVAREDLEQFDAAFEAYDRLLKTCNREELVSDVRLRLGDVLIMRGQFGEAIDAFQRAFETLPADEDRAYALFRLGYAKVQAGQPAEAAATYDRLISSYPNSPYASSALLASAQSSYRSGEIDAARQRFSEVLEQGNKVAATEAAHWIARIHIAKGDHQQAIQVVREQLDRGTDGPFTLELQMDLAEALSMDAATLEESMERFERIYRDAPNDRLAPRALYNAAFSALQLNRPKEALRLGRQFIEKFPQDPLAPDVRFVAAEAQLMSGDAKSAAETYRKLLQIADSSDPQRPMWLLRAGAAHNASGQHAEAVSLLRDELDRLPASSKTDALIVIGQAQLRLDQPQQAADSFKDAAEIDPAGPRAGEALFLAGRALFAADRQAAAVESFQQAVAIRPESTWTDRARYQLGQIASSRSQYEQAIAFYQPILDSGSDSRLTPYAKYGKGWAQLQLGRDEAALKTLTPIVESNSAHPIYLDALLARGITRRRLGQNELASDDLQRFLESKPRGVNLAHVLYELALIDQQKNRPDDAARKLKRLVTEVPDYPAMAKVLYELGWSLQESGEAAEAVKYFSRLIRDYPSDPLVAEAAYFVGQQHYRSQRWQPAAESFATAARNTSDPELSEKSLYKLGWSHFKAGNFSASERAFVEQKEKHPQGQLAFDAQLMIGENRFKREEFDSALDAYQIARDEIENNDQRAESFRDDAERQIRELALLHGGQSAAQLEKWEQAIGWYNELRQRFPATDYLPQVFYELGFAYQQKGEREQALKLYREVADNYRSEIAARARFMMGEIYFAMMQFDQAIPEFQRVMYGFGAQQAPARIKNWQAKSGFEAGRCGERLMQMAKTDSARTKSRELTEKFFQYVINKHPQHELADDSRKRLEALSK